MYYNIAVNISSKDPQKALHLSDSLYKDALSDRKKVKALLLSADILVKQSKQGEGIKYALKALNFAKTSADYNYQARIYGFLSTQCRTIGFYKKGKLYLEEGIAISSMFPDEGKKLQYLAMGDHEMAEYALVNKEFEKALQYIEKAVAYYKTIDIGPYKSFVLANTQQLIGRCYIGLNKHDLALNHFKIANKNVKNSQAENSIFAALIYQGIGESYMKLKKNDSALVYLRKALKFSEPADNTFLKEKVYDSFSRYFQNQQQADSAVVYLSKYNQTVRASQNRNKKQIDMVLDFLGENPTHETADNWMLELGVSLLLISGGVGCYMYRNKLKSRAVSSADNIEATANKTVPVELSPEMIERFNQKLKLFEYEERFLDKTLSYSMLATELGTNTKYLNYFLKHNLQTDYRTYINTLRIQFITDELTTNPDARKFTLAHLADISGYGSYSAFAVNFKRVMKQSPSTYIQELK